MSSWTGQTSGGELIARLKGMFKTDFAFPPLTDDQISTIKGLLHPVTIVREVPAIASSLPPEVDEPLPLMPLDCSAWILNRSAWLAR